MNPLTLVKRIQNINKREATLGISEDASWHAKYRDSAYVYVGGIPFDLTEGDLLAVFAQYGEIVDVNLIRDKGTGKSKGFAFVAYEDQRSTNLAVDNLNGAQILGRTIRVDHVTKYKKMEEEDEETRQQKREERGVCRAFQKGECNRGDSCKFSHDEQRAANTGWGAEEDKPSRWVQDKFKNPEMDRRSGRPDHRGNDDYQRPRKNSNNERAELEHKDTHDGSSTDKRSRSSYNEPDSKVERDWRNENRSRKYESESHHREDTYSREKEARSGRDRDISSRDKEGRPGLDRDTYSREKEGRSGRDRDTYSREKEGRSGHDREKEGRSGHDWEKDGRSGRDRATYSDHHRREKDERGR
ncbi:zinc finger CCCH domain-containing protein 25-like [Salvia divinorum]|uniref:Zinc finger CCCH domain-containing protein 25-like n=1 Tax=Salvia divinorum TaxID=28513 RepID=A0ABD1HYU4_SALDI